MKFAVALLVPLICLIGTVAAAAAGPVAPGIWYEFSFGAGVVAAKGCAPADPAGFFCIPSGGTPTTFADAPPWTFVAPAGGAVLTVTDAFDTADSFDVFDFGGALGITSLPGGGFCGADPVVCLADPGASKGFFELGAGAHSITIVHALGSAAGAGYFKWDPTETVPLPGTLGLVMLGAALARQRLRTV